MEENDDKLQLQRLAGGCITKFAPIFSPDGSLLFVVMNKNVQVYSSTTGQCTRVLEGAKDPLISLEYDLLDKKILVACTTSGEIIRWNWSRGTIKSRIQLTLTGEVQYQTFNFLNLFKSKKKRSSPCAFVTVVRNKNPVQYFVFETLNGRNVKCPLNILLQRNKVMVDVDKSSFKYLVMAQGPHLYFINYKTWEWKKLTNTANQPITCLKIHPEEEMVATGDEVGKITLWRQFFKSSEEVRMTEYHWHHNKVTSLAFSYSGSSFYSGGLETVLVKWDILLPDKLQFVPRMSGIILHVTSSDYNTNIAVCTADNGIQILGVDFHTTCTIQDFTYLLDDKTGKSLYPCGLRVNPQKNTLVLNGRMGHLQFYSTYTKTMLYNVDIVLQNIHSYDPNKTMYNTRVTQAAFNLDWMATGEVFNDEQYLPEVCLKFWNFDKKTQSYGLNTIVDLPHEGGIRAIEFSNPYNVDNLLCATVGNDNIIKIWSMEDSNKIQEKDRSKVWYCVGQTDYKKMPIESIIFSQDGSLLAAGFGNNLCIYKAENLKLLTALTPGGNFDGYLQKAQIRIPKLKQNGSKVDLNTKRQKLVQLFSNLLHTNDEKALKEIKNSVKTRRIREIQTIDDTQKQMLYKKIKSMNELNLFQKLLLYQKLGISFQVSEEWHSKMADYVRTNIPSARKTNDLKKQVARLNLKLRFKAKYKINEYERRQLNPDQNITNKMALLLSLFAKSGTKIKKKLNLPNGIGGHSEESTSDNIIVHPPMQSLLSIKKVLFCHGDFAHLVIACTEHRVLIWNLLTLRLQTVLKLSSEQIAIDPQTNLVSVFTKNQELYIFSPSDALTLYFRSKMPRVLGAVWIPKKNPKPQAIIVNWQSRSTLYFLTDQNEILYLGLNEDSEKKPLTFKNEAKSPSAKYSTFGTFATNKVKDKQKSQLNRQGLSIGVHGKAAVKSFLEMSSHTMAPLSLLCNDFLKSVIELNLPDKSAKTKKSENVTINGHDESSDNDEDCSAKRTIIEKAAINTKTTSNAEALSEEYLGQIAAETIEIAF